MGVLGKVEAWTNFVRRELASYSNVKMTDDRISPCEEEKVELSFVKRQGGATGESLFFEQDGSSVNNDATAIHFSSFFIALLIKVVCR